MVDYKKKYLKYKKKYLAIKKLKGGMKGWLELAAKRVTEGVASAGEGAQEGWSGLGKLASKGVEAGEELVKWSIEKTSAVQGPLKGPPRPGAYGVGEGQERYFGRQGEMRFHIFKPNAPTQFNERMACEGWGHAGAARLGGRHDLDRFILIKRGEPGDLLPENYAHEAGQAQIIQYPQADKDPNKPENIYSDHEAILMPLYTGVENNYKHLITMNLEGFCWPNYGVVEVDPTWSEQNQIRLRNVLELLTPFLAVGSGNIFLFQEVVLKTGAKLNDEEKTSLLLFRTGLQDINQDYVLIHDGCTGAILYDSTEWSLEEIINIDRRYLDVDGMVTKDEKKSNGYRFQNRHQPAHEMCVVNIHLKASIDVVSGILATAQRTYPGERDEEQRRYEMANIYSIMRSYLGERHNIPIYFGGDWNSNWEGYGVGGEGAYPCYTDAENLRYIEENRHQVNMILYGTRENMNTAFTVLPPPPLPAAAPPAAPPAAPLAAPGGTVQDLLQHHIIENHFRG